MPTQILFEHVPAAAGANGSLSLFLLLPGTFGFNEIELD
jgi:hypothetical protein